MPEGHPGVAFDDVLLEWKDMHCKPIWRQHTAALPHEVIEISHVLANLIRHDYVEVARRERPYISCRDADQPRRPVHHRRRFGQPCECLFEEARWLDRSVVDVQAVGVHTLRGANLLTEPLEQPTVAETYVEESYRSAGPTPRELFCEHFHYV